MAVVANPYAAKAAADILRRGGSAIDASITAQLVLTLVEPQSSGIGGGAFLLHYDKRTRKLSAYDGREKAPQDAEGDLFLNPDNSPVNFYKALVGGRAVGVPGVLRMLEMVHKQHGVLPWSSLFEYPINLAAKGFKVSKRLNMLINKDKHLGTQADARRYFFPEDGRAPPVGDILRNPDYANTLRIIAEKGADGFYFGPIARDIVAAVRNADNPGLLSENDMAKYRALRRTPICRIYKGMNVCGMPPPTSGGVASLQILGILENFDLSKLSPNSPESIHLISEASRLAYADRELYIADPDFVPIPLSGLIGSGYLRSRSSLIDLDQSMGKASPGTPVKGIAENEGSQGFSPEMPSTSHFSIVDKHGNAVSMTSSIENTFGSRLMVRGFLLNNQLTDFSFKPFENGEKLANSVEPGKRPRSSMSPTVVLDNMDRLQYLLGSPGGSRIIAFVAKTLIALIDWGYEPEAAVSLAHHANLNGATYLEDKTELTLQATTLRKMGHQVRITPLVSGLHVIQVKKGMLLGGADPRREGVVIGE